MIDYGAFMSGLGGVVIGAGIILIWLQQTLKDYARLKKQVEEQVEGRLRQLEQCNDGTQKRCVDMHRRMEAAEVRLAPVNVQLLTEQIQRLTRQLQDVDTKLDRYLEVNARHDERIKTLFAKLESVPVGERRQPLGKDVR